MSTLLPPSRVSSSRGSDSAELGWGPRVCISARPPGNANPAGLEITPREPLFEATRSSMWYTFVATDRIPQSSHRFLPGKYPAESNVCRDWPFVTASFKNSVTYTVPYLGLVDLTHVSMYASTFRCVDQMTCQSTYYKWSDCLIWTIMLLDMHREMMKTRNRNARSKWDASCKKAEYWRLKSWDVFEKIFLQIRIFIVI